MEKRKKLLSLIVCTMMIAGAFAVILMPKAEAIGMLVETISPKDDKWVSPSTVRFTWAIANINQQAKVIFFIDGDQHIERTVYYGVNKYTVYDWDNFPQGHFSWYIVVYRKNLIGNYVKYGTSDTAFFRHDSVLPGTPSPDDGVPGWTNDNTPTFSWAQVPDPGGPDCGLYRWDVDGNTPSSYNIHYWDYWEMEDWYVWTSTITGNTYLSLSCMWNKLDNDYAYAQSYPMDTTGKSTLLLTFNCWIDVDPWSHFYCWVKTRANPQDMWTDSTPWPNPIAHDYPDHPYTIDISHDIGTGTQILFEYWGDPDDRVQRVFWQICDMSILNPTALVPSGPVTLSPQTDGVHTFNVRALDTAMNLGNTGSHTFYIDTQAPGINDIQNGDDTWRNSGGTTYDVDFWDQTYLSGLKNAQYKITTAPNQGGSILRDWTDIFYYPNPGTYGYTANWQIDFNACQQGKNYVSVRAFDHAGNYKLINDVFYVLKDNEPPSLPNIWSTTHPSQIVWSSDNDVEFSWWSVTAGPSPIIYYYKINNGPWSPTTSTSIRYNNLADGIYTFYVYSADTGGISAVNSYTVKIDTGQPPAPTPDDYTDGWAGDEPTFWWNEPFDASGIAGYYWKIDDGPDTWRPASLPRSVTVPNQPDGIHVFYIKAKDNKGFIGGYGVHVFLVDVTPPSTPVPDDGVSGCSGDNTPTFIWDPPIELHSGIMGYYWKVDGGAEQWTTASAVVLPQQSDGIHKFYVRGVDNRGNVGSWGSHEFYIDTKPVANANGPYVVEEGTPVILDGSASYDPGNEILYYRWDFENDGTWDTLFSTTPIASHTWYDDHSGTIRVEVTDGFFTATDTSTVTVNNVAPSVSLGPDLLIDEGETVHFAGSVYDPGTLDTHTYLWDFGDGTTSSEKCPSHTYLDDGTWTVTLTVTDDDGGIGTDSMVVTVQNVAPIVNAGEDTTINEGDTVFFGATIDDPGYDTQTYSWDFGDSGTSSDPTPSHTYQDNGIYTVTLTVTDDEGGVGTDSLTVTALNVAPTAYLGPDIAVDEGSPVTLGATATDPSPLDTLTFEWDLDDDGLFDDATGQTATHTWYDDGIYTASVKVTDDDGDWGTDSMDITVINVPPTALATVDQNPVNEGVLVAFTGTQTDPGSDTFTYQWDFGDSGTSTLQNPTYAYMDDGIFAATLTVTDDEGGSDTETIIMHVNDLPPIADAGPDRSVSIIDVVTFEASGSSSYPDSIVAYDWDFGDSTTATGMVVTHTFGTIGTYTVTLTVTDDDGSKDTDTCSVKSLAPGVELISSFIAFSPVSPVDVGAVVTATCDITNYGNTDASNVTIRFYDGDPDENDNGIPDNGAVQIGSDIVFSTILSEETITATVTWTSTIGYHDIYAWIDPDNLIPEYNDTNNQDYDTMIVGPELVADNLQLTPASLVAVGDTLTISVDVTNYGGTAVTDVLVKFYSEYPDQNHNNYEDPAVDIIGDTNITSLAPGATQTVTISWTPSAVGNYDISVWVDPSIPPGGGWGEIFEAIETNNIATQLLQVGPDLAIDFTDISFSNNPVTQGAAVTITAVIHNNGGELANGVEVSFYHTEIKNKNEIGTVVIPTIPAEDSYVVSMTFDTVALGPGYYSIWIDIDRMNNIDEFNEENNQAYSVLSII